MSKAVIDIRNLELGEIDRAVSVLMIAHNGYELGDAIWRGFNSEKAAYYRQKFTQASDDHAIFRVAFIDSEMVGLAWWTVHDSVTEEKQLSPGVRLPPAVDRKILEDTTRLTTRFQASLFDKVGSFGYLWELQVSRQGKGVGKALLYDGLKLMARSAPLKVGLTSRASDQALGFYRSLGFQHEGERIIIDESGNHNDLVLYPMILDVPSLPGLYFLLESEKEDTVACDYGIVTSQTDLSRTGLESRTASTAASQPLCLESLNQEQ